MPAPPSSCASASPSSAAPRRGSPRGEERCCAGWAATRRSWELALREAAALRQLARVGPDAVVVAAMAGIAALPPSATARPQLAAALRGAKRVVALATAVADIGGIWTLERVTEALSDLAEAALGLCVRHLLLAGHQSGELRPARSAHPDAGCGFTALGMGKLGARRPDYSSDIDLILLQDQNSGVYHGGRPAPSTAGSRAIS